MHVKEYMRRNPPEIRLIREPVCQQEEEEEQTKELAT